MWQGTVNAHEFHYGDPTVVKHIPVNKSARARWGILK